MTYTIGVVESRIGGSIFGSSQTMAVLRNRLSQTRYRRLDEETTKIRCTSCFVRADSDRFLRISKNRWF